MARAPQQRAPQASGGDDFYDEEDNYNGADGEDDFGSGRGEGGDEPTGASEYSREGDPELEEEPLDPDYEDPPEPRRGEGRVQRLANENRDLRRQLEESRRPAATQQPPQQPRLETETELEQRIALQDEATKNYERWRWSNQQQQAQINQTRAEGVLGRDQLTFRELCRSDKLAARLRDKVEEEFQARLKQNVFVPREDIYYWLAGRERARGSPETRRARETAARRVERQTVRPASGGSDVARPNRRERVDERTARARRLEGQQI